MKWIVTRSHKLRCNTVIFRKLEKGKQEQTLCSTLINVLLQGKHRWGWMQKLLWMYFLINRWIHFPKSQRSLFFSINIQVTVVLSQREKRKGKTRGLIKHNTKIYPITVEQLLRKKTNFVALYDRPDLQHTALT